MATMVKCCEQSLFYSKFLAPLFLVTRIDSEEEGNYLSSCHQQGQLEKVNYDYMFSN